MSATIDPRHCRWCESTEAECLSTTRIKCCPDCYHPTTQGWALKARARESLSLWDKTCGVTIEVHTGMCAAEDAYRNAPVLVADLLARIEELERGTSTGRHVAVDQQMLVSAVRYALGRRTYIVGWTVDEVIRVWPELSNKVRAVIARDLHQFLSCQVVLGESIATGDNSDWCRLVNTVVPDPPAPTPETAT